MASAYEALVPEVALRVPNAPDALALRALRWGGKAFCQKTNLWAEWLDVIDLVERQPQYTLTHSYDAAIERLLTVKTNGTERNADQYELTPDHTAIRFNAGQATWESTELEAFDAAETYAINDIATYDGKVYVAAAANGPAAWDITNWDETEAYGLLVRVAFAPLTTATETEMPAWMIERWADALVAGAYYRMVSQPGPWGNPQQALIAGQIFETLCADAAGEHAMSYSGNVLRVEFPAFC